MHSVKLISCQQGAYKFNTTNSVKMIRQIHYLCVKNMVDVKIINNTIILKGQAGMAMFVSFDISNARV